MVSAVAVDNLAPYASDYLDSCAIATTAEGKGKMAVDYTVSGTGIMTEVGTTAVQIEQYKDGDWVNYVVLPGSYTTNDVSHSATVYFYGTIGVKYRAIIYAYAKDNTGSDSRAYDGSGVYCK